MPPAPRFARENREFTVLVLAGQLRVSVLLSFQRSRETCSINVRGECVGSAITMQWGDNSCVAADRLGEHPTPSDEVQLPGVPGTDRQIGVSQQNLVCYDCSRLREDR